VASEPVALPAFEDLGTAFRHRGLWRQAFDRLVRNRLAMVGLTIIVAMAVLSVLTATVDAVGRYPPSAQAVREAHQGPSAAHWLGTDNLGRDNWARTWEGVRISLRIGIGTQVLVAIIGVAVGAAAALGGRFLDNLIMRFVDVAYAFPDLLAIVLMRAVLSQRAWPIIGNGDPQIPGLPGTILQVILAIGLVSWVTTARLVRGQMLSLKASDFVTAARALGASTPRIVFVHMLPNTLGPVIVVLTFGIPLAIYAEAVLALIGFGVEPPTASLGTLVFAGYSYFRSNPWMISVPAATIAILMLSFTFLGDGLRDALDPRGRR